MSSFFDTNILVYGFLDDAKRGRALELLAEGGWISAQVLNEFTNVASKKHRRSWAEIEAALAVIRGRFPEVVPLTADLNTRGVVLARDHGFAFYDALIVAAALEAECDTLYSEDMHHGGRFGGLTIINPFRGQPP